MVPSPAAASAGPAVTGTGTPLCNAGYSGAMTFNTPLKNGGSATSEVVTLQLKFTGCSGGSPVPAAGVYNAKGIVTGAGANDCANYFSPPLTTPPVVNFTPTAHLDGAVAWSPTGTINPSNVSFSMMRIWTGANNRLRIRLPAAGSLVTGSYAATANLTLRVLQPGRR